ncbi:Chemotaxis protein methyltransferase CheR [Enterobacter hormaechei]|nr:Chemotaxis protein methyltransferase CheR [Enterobacter hormaechei]
MVYNRLVRRLRTLGLDDFGRYLSMLEANQNSAEWQAFINSLTTNLTAFFFFFREAHHFPVLAEHARRRGGEYRVWSAAASTGGRAVLAGHHPGGHPGHGAGSLESVRQRHRHGSAGKSP